MKLIVGLGNPGDKFKNTKHNIGFESLDKYALDNEIKFINKHNCLFYKSTDFILIKPQTFMNNSGDAVLAVTKFYKINLEDILVIYDDASMDFGKVKTKKDGSHGGQNGIRDIIEKLGSDQFWRTKLGVGFNQKYELSNWVLSKFSDKDQKIKEELIEKANKIIDLFIKDEKLEIGNLFN